MKNVNIDIVRIFATWMVLTVHIGQLTGIDFLIGAKGVQLFFVLSGYLAFASLEKNSSPINYYKRRAQKILPVYWFSLILLYIEDLALIIHQSSTSEAFAGQCSYRFLRYVFFLQCFTPTENWFLWNNHSALWTMSSFVAFYIIAPWLYKIIKKFLVGFSILALFLYGTPYIVVFISKIFANYPEEAHIEWFAYSNPLTVLYCFLLGAVLFVAFKEHKHNLYLFIVAITLAVTSLSWYQYELFFVIVIGLAVLLPPITQNERIVKMISFISGGSFALYLIHPMVLQVEGFIWRRLGINNGIFHIIFLYFSCIVVSYFLYYTVIIKIEKYINRLGCKRVD